MNECQEHIHHHTHVIVDDFLDKLFKCEDHHVCEYCKFEHKCVDIGNKLVELERLIAQ